MSDSGESDDEETALNHSGNSSDYTKHWSNRADVDAELPADDIDVKSEWIGTTIYLPPKLRDELNLVFQEYKYECNRNGDIDLKKLRHFYPLIVALGVEQFENTESDTIAPLLSYISSEYE
jgi:hypothetical protein